MPTKSASNKKGRVFSIGMLDVADGGNFRMILQVELFARLYFWAAEPVRETGLAMWRKVLTPKQQSRVREIQISNLGKTVIVNRIGQVYTQDLQTEVRH